MIMLPLPEIMISSATAISVWPTDNMWPLIMHYAPMPFDPWHTSAYLWRLVDAYYLFEASQFAPSLSVDFLVRSQMGWCRGSLLCWHLAPVRDVEIRHKSGGGGGSPRFPWHCGVENSFRFRHNSTPVSQVILKLVGVILPSQYASCRVLGSPGSLARWWDR